jgi:hypothetical protein
MLDKKIASPGGRSFVSRGDLAQSGKMLKDDVDLPFNPICFDMKLVKFIIDLLERFIYTPGRHLSGFESLDSPI